MNKAAKDGADLEEARLRQQAIGARLRQLFDDVVNEPVPNDFLEILRRAEPSAECGDRPPSPSGHEGDHR